MPQYSQTLSYNKYTQPQKKRNKNVYDIIL